jgi:hypothetical protein
MSLCVQTQLDPTGLKHHRSFFALLQEQALVVFSPWWAISNVRHFCSMLVKRFLFWVLRDTNNQVRVSIDEEVETRVNKLRWISLTEQEV